jgi:hypothetical protein
MRVRAHKARMAAIRRAKALKALRRRQHLAKLRRIAAHKKRVAAHRRRMRIAAAKRRAAAIKRARAAALKKRLLAAARRQAARRAAWKRKQKLIALHKARHAKRVAYL